MAVAAPPRSSRPPSDPKPSRQPAPAYPPGWGMPAPSPPAPQAPAQPSRRWGDALRVRFSRPERYPSQDYKRRAVEQHKAEEKFRTFFGPFFYYAKRILFMGLLIAAIVFLFFFFANAEFRNATFERISVQLERWHLGPVLEPLLKWIKPTELSKIAAGISSFETRPDYAAPELHGVTIERFAGVEVYEGDPIFMEAEIVVDALPQEETPVEFACLLIQGNKTFHEGIATIGGQPEGQSRLLVPKGKKGERIFVYCNFPPVEQIKGSIAEYKTFADYRAYLVWAYKPISTETIMHVVTQQRDIQITLQRKNIDSLAAVRRLDYVDDQDFAKDKCVRGCGLVDLGMDLQSRMPLAEDGAHYLLIKLFGLTTWKGNLQKLHSLAVIFPEIVSIKNDGCLRVGKGTTIPSPDGSSLRLAEGDLLVNQVNAQLAQDMIPVVELRCPLAVDAGDQEIPLPGTIRANAVYDYGGKEVATVRVKRKEPLEQDAVIEA